MPKKAKQVNLENEELTEVQREDKPIVQISFKTSKLVVNTTDEGLDSFQGKDPSDQRAWVQQHARIAKGAALEEGDWDKEVKKLRAFIKGA